MLWIDSIALGDATILSAELRVTFLDISKSGATEAESFFDLSGGFEDFAILSSQDAVLLEDASIGPSAAPVGVVYTEEESASAVLAPPDPGTAPGAPSPPVWMLGLLGVFLFIRSLKIAPRAS